MFGRIGEVTDAIFHLKPTRPAFCFILRTIRRFCVLAFLGLGDVGDNRLLKSIIDHRNRRRSAIDNRLSAIIATSLHLTKFQIEISSVQVTLWNFIGHSVLLGEYFIEPTLYLSDSKYT